MLKAIANYFQNNGQFPKRIKRRHEIFWNDPNAEIIRNTIMSENDDIEKWQDVSYWQRKLSNKYNAREFAKMNGCQVPDLYWRGTDFDKIDFTSLPDYYVIRPTIGHSSRLVFIMDHGVNLFDHKNYTPEEIKQTFKQELVKNPDLEILIEEFLRNEEGNHTILNDYKFFCFNGEIASCFLINRVSPKSGYGSFYDEHWNKMKMINITYPPKNNQKAPDCFKDMVAQAKVLSKLYGIFVRLDFYATSKGAVFGEFTPTPSMGKNFSSYGKKLLLKYWDKYCNELI